MSNVRLILMASVLLFAVKTSVAADDNPEQLPEVIVTDEKSLEQSRIDRGAVLPTERISKKRIEQKRAQTLAEAVAHESGVDTQTSCANCGAKRVTINGLRGEHTTIMVDGVPLHSAVSSFYGVDAVPMAGVEAIDVIRGAGAALTAPEAIGGVLNIITETPKRPFATTNLQGGTANTSLLSGAAAETALDGKFRFLAAGQFARQGLWDIDKNGVSEFPEFTNAGVIVKAQTDLTASQSLEVRYAWQSISILGGTTDGTRPTTFLTNVDSPSFDGNDVSRRYLDSQSKIADVIGLKRHELVGRFKQRVGVASQLQLTTSGAWQAQDSIYFHGYDYTNRDFLSFSEIRYTTPLNVDHVLTLGADGRLQNMNSSSEKLYGIKNLPPDDFKFQNGALYAQDTWSVNESHELSLASRFDYLSVKWPFQNRIVERFLVSPRVHWKWMHDAQWTSRLSYGRGYRAPLSFFESQHGLSEDGFTIGLTEIETAHSLGYAAHHLTNRWEFGGGVYGTLLQNTAYAEESQNAGDSAQFKNYSDSLGVVSSYLSGIYRAENGWTLETSIEDFRLAKAYKRLLPNAVTEQRARLRIEKTWGGFETSLICTVIGSRDLALYRYDQHYLTYEEVPADPNNPALGNVEEVSARKNTKAPLYATLDFTVAYHPAHSIEFSASVLNLTSFTQTGYGDSPLAWGQHGPDPRHFHLDNMHVWGPLRGRVFILGLKTDL